MVASPPGSSELIAATPAERSIRSSGHSRGPKLFPPGGRTRRSQAGSTSRPPLRRAANRLICRRGSPDCHLPTHPAVEALAKQTQAVATKRFVVTSLQCHDRPSRSPLAPRITRRVSEPLVPSRSVKVQLTGRLCAIDDILQVPKSRRPALAGRLLGLSRQIHLRQNVGEPNHPSVASTDLWVGYELIRSESPSGGVGPDRVASAAGSTLHIVTFRRTMMEFLDQPDSGDLRRCYNGTPGDLGEISGGPPEKSNSNPVSF
jgi:hypothetical protein